MRTLIIEDDFTSRKILQKILLGQGECDIAVNAVEGINAFCSALDSGTPYDLLCVDISMPDIDGNNLVSILRKLEEKKNIVGRDGVKIVMTTGNEDPKVVFASFRAGCESYLLKPVTPSKLFTELIELNLIDK